MTALIFALLIPLSFALGSGFVAQKWLRPFNLVGSSLLLVTATVLLFEVVANQSVSVAFGGWPSPIAIVFMADGFSALMVLSIALVFFCVLLFAKEGLLKGRGAQYSKRLSFVLMQGVIASAVAVSLTQDLFNLYVWFELMLIGVLGLFVLSQSMQNKEAAIKYFSLNMLGTLLMLSAIGLIYGTTGHLNYEMLKQFALDENLSPQLQIYTGLLVLALLMKIGAFPLFLWLPATYHALPLPLLALIGGLLTKVTAFVLLRLSGLSLELDSMSHLLGWIAVFTMLSGVIGAAYHWDLRRILAFHIISQVGFLLLGIALLSHQAAVGTMLFLIHNVLVKTNLFLIVGVIWWLTKHYDLRQIGGLYPTHSMLAILFLINSMALVGVPPTSGFWGKFLLLKETFHQEFYFWAIAALITGLLTLYSMSKIWLEAFWKPAVSDSVNLNQAIPMHLTLPIIGLTVIVLLIGFYPEPLIQFLQGTESGFYRDSITGFEGGAHD